MHLGLFEQPGQERFFQPPAKGVRPVDLPRGQPAKFELVLNLTTAKALGLALPPDAPIRAEQVILEGLQFSVGCRRPGCPCGFATEPAKECTCTPLQIQRYLARISGPLLDRIDIHIDVPPLKYREITTDDTGEPSAAIRDRVRRARAIQQERFRRARGVYCNAHMASRHIKRHCAIQGEAACWRRPWSASASPPAPTTASSRWPAPSPTWPARRTSSRSTSPKPSSTVP